MSEPSDEEVEALLKEIPPQSASGPCIDDGLLLAHREGRSGAQSETVERHLSTCSSCRALLAELDQVSPPMETWALATLRRRRRWPAIGAITALAAGVLLGLILLPRDELPGYELRGPLGGVRTTRGAEGESKLFVPGSIFSFVLRPERRVEEQVSLLVFVDAPEGLTLHRSLDAASGGFRFEARAQELFGERYGVRKVHAAIVRGRTEGPLEGTEEQIRRRLRSHRWMSMEIEYRASVEE
jgi:hypothetical protein